MPICFVNNKPVMLIGGFPGSGRGSSIGKYTLSFDNSNLEDGVLSISHGLGQMLVQVQVFDENYNLISPDEITLVDSNDLTVDLSAFGAIEGTWNVVVIG